MKTNIIALRKKRNYFLTVTLVNVFLRMRAHVELFSLKSTLKT